MGGGSKIPIFGVTYFLHGPLCVYSTSSCRRLIVWVDKNCLGLIRIVWVDKNCSGFVLMNQKNCLWYVFCLFFLGVLAPFLFFGGFYLGWIFLRLFMLIIGSKCRTTNGIKEFLL